FLPYAAAAAPAPSRGALVNDVHSQLNETRVDRVVAVESEAALRARALLPVARRYAPRLRGLRVLLPVDFGTALLVRHEPDEPLSRRLPRGARSPATGQGERHGNDQRALCAARRARRVPCRRAGGFAAARCAAHLRNDPPHREGRRELPRLGARAVG